MNCTLAAFAARLTLILLMSVSLRAADTATATISGRIQNGDSGIYLNNAKVSVTGTNLVALTDQTGAYRLVNVPPGRVVVEVFYTGFDALQTPVDVSPGQNLQRDFELKTGSVVTLDKFTVKGAADLETIATNEQRFASNIKLVAAPGENEFVLEGNVGEFMKSLPGVSAEYSDVEIMGISVRGFGSNVVGVTMDGSNLAGANYTGSARTFQTPNLSMNNISRVEITAVPTPSTPADSLGGSVNLVTKSAFERAKAQLSYSAFLSG
ncbi:MAG: hypothetical protein RIQ93_3472, partial [Verrucomicrobiota bacterium]